MLLAIPLAWLQLVHQRVRFVATLIGISLVVALLFVQLGFQDALFNSAVRVHENLQGELFMVSAQYQALTAQQFFPRSRLYQTLAAPQVESVSPLYIQFGKLKSIETGQKYAIFVFGIDLSNPPFQLPGVQDHIDALKSPEHAIFDRYSRPEFGPIAARFESNQPVTVEVSTFNEITRSRQYKITGLFGLGTSFGIDGSMMINDSAFLNTFRNIDTTEIGIGTIRLAPSANVVEVQSLLRRSLSQDVRILTRAEFIALEKSYWDLRTPVGFTFKVMVIFGFLVGIGVSYQVLYTNISAHIIEYATLKAIGFRNRYLLGAVLQQAVMLAVLGFIPGVILSTGIYSYARSTTNLPMVMTFSKGYLVLLSIVVMCIFSGILAIQKLRSADPADIF